MGPAANVKAPAGATRVNLAGKTVMPTIVDTHVHLSATREALANGSAPPRDLRRQRRDEPGTGRAGADVVQDAHRKHPPAPRAIFTAGRGITVPEPGRTQAPYWITSAAEAARRCRSRPRRRSTSSRSGSTTATASPRSCTPEIYGAVIDEAHKAKLRVTAHLFTLDDAKGLLQGRHRCHRAWRARRDVDDEFMAMVKKRAGLVLVPNLPDRGVEDRHELARRTVLSAGELQKLEAGNTDRPEAQTAFGIQARNLAKMSAAGVRIALGSDGNNAWAPHVEMADMVAAGMTPMQVIVAATRNGAQFCGMTDTRNHRGRQERGSSSSSTPTRSTTSRTRGGSRRST